MSIPGNTNYSFCSLIVNYQKAEKVFINLKKYNLKHRNSVPSMSLTIQQ